MARGVMSEMPTLTKSEILAALSSLDERLKDRGVTGELCLFGGAVMVLVFDARESTRDVDALFAPRTEMRDAAIAVAEERGLPETWLNDGVKGFVSANGELTEEGLPKFRHLRLVRPTAEYLLAMKCLAARTGDLDERGDREDVLTLCRHLCLSKAADVLGIVGRFYPDSTVPAKTRYFVEELLQELRPAS
jgi:hypothetical protein